MNPANLRWKYLLDAIRDESNAKEVDNCIESLHKFPLVTLVNESFTIFFQAPARNKLETTQH